MSQSIGKGLRLLGWVLMSAPSWTDVEHRLAESEAERDRLAAVVATLRATLVATGAESGDGDLAAAVRALKSDWAEREVLLAERLSSAESASAAAAVQAAGLDGQLQACMRERELLSLSIGRAGAKVKALARRRDRLTAERDDARRELAAGDASGRIRDLEAENRRLTLRVADLERYLAETRGEDARAYL